MYDATLQFSSLAEQRATILTNLELTPGAYYLVTIHRAYNTDDPRRLSRLLYALSKLDLPVVFPVHPRTRKAIGKLDGWSNAGELAGQKSRVQFLPPLGYLDMLKLERQARRILTDSGGVQKEAYFFSVPCITLRPETEWVETVETGWNRIVDADPEQIAWAAREASWPETPPPPIFGDGHAAEKIVEAVMGRR